MSVSLCRMINQHHACALESGNGQAKDLTTKMRMLFMLYMN